MNDTGNPLRESKCEVAGWRFVTWHGDAISTDLRTSLAQNELGLSTRIPLPEMVFAQNRLEITDPSQRLHLEFQATRALKLWAVAHDGAHWDHTNFDFTYCTNYHGSVERFVNPDDAEAVAVLAVPTSERLPLDKLRQHVEILFYDRIVLFEDDVRDLGEIYLEVKTRVMGFGFLVLCRYYCRLDGKSVRLMDTRYYHEFGQDFIWRDHEVREATIAELQKLMTNDGPVETSADVVYMTLSPTTTITEKIFLTA